MKSKKIVLLFSMLLFLVTGCSNNNNMIGKENRLVFTHNIGGQFEKTAYFQNSATNNFINLRWNFGDEESSENTATGDVTSHKYTKYRKYTVSLTAFNTETNKDEIFTKVIELPEPKSPPIEEPTLD